LLFVSLCHRTLIDGSTGPVIGGFAAQFKGYKWTQWCTIFIALASYAFILPMHETYKKIILKRRAKKLGIAPPPAPQLSALGYAKMLLTITVARPVIMLGTEPIVFFLSLYTGFTFSVLFAVSTAASLDLACNESACDMFTADAIYSSSPPSPTPSNQSTTSRPGNMALPFSE